MIKTTKIRKEIEVTEENEVCDICQETKLTKANKYIVRIEGPEEGVGKIEFYGRYMRVLVFCHACFYTHIVNTCEAAK